MNTLRVKSLMTESPVMIGPDQTLGDAARTMKRVNCGVLPVGTNRALKGIITDRDIVMRTVAEGRNPKTEKVKNCMTAGVHTCSPEDTLDAATFKMQMHKVCRLVVTDRAGAVVGILSLGGILRQNACHADISGIVMRATARMVA